MKNKHAVLPAVKVLDEWTKEIEGHEFVFQIKMTLDSDNIACYPVLFWEKENKYSNWGESFEVRPSRNQVEEKFSQTIEDCLKNHLK